MPAVIVMTLCVVGAGHWASADPVFSEVSDSANIHFVHDYALEVEHGRKGLGAAAADYDDDGWVDLYIVNGWGYSNRLYRNNGDGTFTDQTDQVGADLALLERESKQGLFLDYDGDGWLDLLVVNDADAFDPLVQDPPEFMQSQLFRNLGNGQFEDVTVSAQIPPHPYRLSWGMEFGQVGGAAAGDLNGDGYPEIYISYWEDEDTLLRNNADGTFTDITIDSGIDTLSKDSYTPLMWDFNADGLLDIHVCVDRVTPNLLLINQGDLTFIDQAAAAGLDVAAWNEMGAALGDYDNDGDFDLYMTNIEKPDDVVGTDEPAIAWNRFMRNDSIGSSMSFVDIGGSDVEFVRTGWGWGVTFIDYDHDGWLDLAVVNGQDNSPGSPYQTDPSRLFRNDGQGSFTDESDATGFADIRMAKAVLTFDYDRDGDQDLFVTNYLESALLYENVGGAEAGNWLVVDPIGHLPNMHAIGATVHVEAGGVNQMRFITAGTSYLSQEPDLAHFGVGSATTIDSVRIAWADGSEDIVTDVAVNQYIEILQGVGLPPEPPGDPISLEVTGPAIVVEQSTHGYTATSEYENGSSADVTADATWIVIVGGEYAEFDDTNPGTLTASVVDSLETIEVKIQATFESFSATLDVTIVESSADVVGPTLAITDPSTESVTTTEESTITISGAAQDESGVIAVAWSTDQGDAGPCFGLLDWTTGPIRLTEGVTLITVSAWDSLQNAASVEVPVTYTVPEPPINLDPPVDPESPAAPAPIDPPVDHGSPGEDSDDAAPVDQGGDDTFSDDPIEDTVSDPTPNSSEIVRNAQPTAGCGLLGLVNLPVLLMGLCTLRRWAPALAAPARTRGGSGGSGQTSRLGSHRPRVGRIFDSLGSTTVCARPAPHIGRVVGHKSIDQARRLLVHHQHVQVLGLQEALRDRMLQVGQQGVKIAADIEQAAGLVVYAQLSPRPDLERLVQRPRSARESDESVRQISHQRLTLVHGFDKAQFGQSAVPDFSIPQ